MDIDVMFIGKVCLATILIIFTVVVCVSLIADTYARKKEKYIELKERDIEQMKRYKEILNDALPALKVAEKIYSMRAGVNTYDSNRVDSEKERENRNRTGHFL